MTNKKVKKLNSAKLKSFLIGGNLDKKRLLFLESALAGLSISLGTAASKMCIFPEIAPLLFAVGIFMVMAFDLKLITRFVPTGKKIGLLDTLIVLAVNLIAAWTAGYFSPFSAPSPDNLFLFSILGGIVIGLVSWNNIFASPYKVVTAMLLMYMFVHLGLPHVVVYAFLHADLGAIAVVGAGNILGGLGLRAAFYGLKTLR